MKMNERQAAVLTELLKRRKKDGLAYYDADPTQEAFLRCQTLYSMITAENRGGKSTVAAVDIRYTLEGTHPYRPNYEGGTYVLMCPSRRQADLTWRKKLIEDCELMGAPAGIPFIPKHLIKDVRYNKKDGIEALQYVEMHNGKKLYVCWSNYSETWKMLEGIKVDGIWIDENAGDEKLIEEAAVRLRDVQDDPTKPGGGFIKWTATETKINLAYTNFKRLCQDPNEPDFTLFIIPKGENRAITEDSGERAAKLMSEDARKSRIDGIGGAMDVVRVFPTFSRDRHTIRKKYIPDLHDNIWVIYDPGVAHPTGITLIAIRPREPKRYHVFGYFCQRRTSIEDEVAWIKDRLQGRSITGVVYDPSAKKTDKMSIGEARDRSVAMKLMSVLKSENMKPLKFLQGNNVHATGIQKVRECLDENRIICYMDDIGVPKGVIEIENYMGRETKQFTGTDGVVKINDEFPDCIRYLVMSNARWEDHGPNPMIGEVVKHRPMTIDEEQLENSKGIAKRALERRRNRNSKRPSRNRLGRR